MEAYLPTMRNLFLLQFLLRMRCYCVCFHRVSLNMCYIDGLNTTEADKNVSDEYACGAYVQIKNPFYRKMITPNEHAPNLVL